jgi:nucleoside-diphosphate-sugar epimerase
MDTNRRHLEAYRDTTVLVTGGAGAIGSNLCRALATLGASVVVLDDLSSSDPVSIADLAGCQLVEGSVDDQAALDAVFGRRPPRIVFHLAAFFANQNSVEHPEDDLRVNGLGTLKVLEAARRAEVDRFVYAGSSSCVKAPEPHLPIDEDAVSLELYTPYQVTKLLGELYCNYFKNLYGLKAARVRFFNSYGPGEVPGRYRNVIPNWIDAALRGRPLPITGDGQDTRDWTYVGDIVDGLLRVGVMEEAVGEVFNLASGTETRAIEVATRINEITGNQAGIVFAPARNWDSHRRRWASIEKAKRLLGYEPQTDLATGLQHAVAWFRANWSRIRTQAEE